MELDAILKHCQKATLGPWQSFIEGRDHDSGSSFIRRDREDIDLIEISEADQDFIAGVKQDIPRLVAKLRRLKTK